MEIRSITAGQYLEAAVKASVNGADKPAFRQISDSLSHAPEVKERLALDLVAVAEDSVMAGGDPSLAVGLAACFIPSISNQKVPKFVERLEAVILRCFQALEGFDQRLPGSPPRWLTVSSCVASLRELDPARAEALINRIQRDGVGGKGPKTMALLKQLRVKKSNRGNK